MASIITTIEDRLLQLRNEGIRFGPEQVAINEIIEAHNGFNNSTMSNYDMTGKFYNGIRCNFSLFRLLLINHEGTTFYKPGIVHTIGEIFVNTENSDVYMSPYILLDTINDLLAQLPSKEIGIQFTKPRVKISIIQELWSILERDENKDMIEKSVSLKSLSDILKGGPQDDFIIEQTGEDGVPIGVISYDQVKRKFIAIP